MQDFYFYLMFETNFSGHNKIWGAQKFVGSCSRMPLWLRAWFFERKCRSTRVKCIAL